jgi:hypothetical protein
MIHQNYPWNFMIGIVFEKSMSLFSDPEFNRIDEGPVKITDIRLGVFVGLSGRANLSVFGDACLFVFSPLEDLQSGDCWE